MKSYSFNRDSFIVSINSEIVDYRCMTMDNLKINSENEIMIYEMLIHTVL